MRLSKRLRFGHFCLPDFASRDRSSPARSPRAGERGQRRDRVSVGESHRAQVCARYHWSPATALCQRQQNESLPVASSMSEPTHALCECGLEETCVCWGFLACKNKFLWCSNHEGSLAPMFYCLLRGFVSLRICIIYRHSRPACGCCKRKNVK
jgi:hypothetical protein